MNNTFEQMSAMTAVLSDEELSALVAKCEERIKNNERIKRDKLRQELMESLQKIMGDILHNGFNLLIENKKYFNSAVTFSPDDDLYHIEIR